MSNGEKNMDVIKRSDALDALEEWYELYPDSDAAREALSLVRKDIKKLPFAQAEGEWVYCEDEFGNDGYMCSECRLHIPWDYQHKSVDFINDYHTCPFCDARMKGAFVRSVLEEFERQEERDK